MTQAKNAAAPAAVIEEAALLTWLQRGDINGAAELVARASLAPGRDPGRNAYLAMLLAWARHAPETIVSQALLAVRQLPPEAPERVVAMQLLERQSLQTTAFAEKVAPLYDELRARDNETDPIRIALQWHQFRQALWRNDPNAMRSAMQSLGVATTWRINGPWGQHPYLDRDTLFAPEPGPLADEYPRTLRTLARPAQTATRTFSDGAVFFADQRPDGGVFFAETAFRVSRPGPFVLQLETTRAARVRVDGHEWLAVDRMAADGPRLTAVQVELAAGIHRLHVKYVTDSAFGFFRVRLAAVRDGRPVEWLDPQQAAIAMSVATPDLQSPQPTPVAHLVQAGLKATSQGAFCRAAVAFLGAWLLAGRQPWQDARVRDEMTARLLAEWPDSGFAQTVLGLHALSSRRLDAKVRRARAATAFLRVAASQPQDAAALWRLAKVEYALDQDDNALQHAEQAQKLRPSDPAIRRLCLTLYTKRGWNAEADAQADRLKADAWTPQQASALLQHALVRELWPAAQDIVRKWQAQAPGLLVTRLAGYHLRRGDRPAAAQALDELLQLQPENARAEQTRLAISTTADDSDTRRRRLAACLARYPEFVWPRRLQAEQAFWGGQPAAAKKMLQTMGEQFPDVPGIDDLRSELDGQRVVPPAEPTLQDWVATYEKAQQENPVLKEWSQHAGVVLLDESELDVAADGHYTHIERKIYRIQSKELANALGEFRPPQGARVLELRTLRPDGMLLEPDRSQRKADISFSGLTPGDTIEYRLQVTRPSPLDLGGHLGSFYFGAWSIPVFASRLSVSVPRSLPLTAWSRHGAANPHVTETETRRRFQWAVDAIAARQPEPLALPPIAFVPHVDLHVGQTDAAAWSAVRQLWHDQIAGLTPRTRAIDSLAAQLRGPDDLSTAVRRAYAFVRDEIAGDADGGDLLAASAPQTLEARKGSPVVLLLSLLQALGTQPDLWLCRPLRAGDVLPPAPRPDAYPYPVVRVHDGRALRFLDLNDRFTPYDHRASLLRGATCLSILDPHRNATAQPLPEPVDDGEGWHVIIRLSVDRSGSANGQLDVHGFGMQTAEFRRVVPAMLPEKQKQLLEMWLGSLLGGATVSDVQLFDLIDPQRPVRISARLNIDRLMQPTAVALTADTLAAGFGVDDFSGTPAINAYLALAKRESPLLVMGYQEHLTLELTFAPGAALVTGPADFDLHPIHGEVRQTVRFAGNVWHLERHVTLPEHVVAPADFESLRQFLGQFMAATRQRLILRWAEPASRQAP